MTVLDIPSALRPAPSESLQSQMTFVLQYVLRWQCPAETVQKRLSVFG